ncbi:MAG: hypothetical protein Q8942_04055 [Bacillota bacterium]|nr:hypothetical protein [Bacillota bacterium]
MKKGNSTLGIIFLIIGGILLYNNFFHVNIFSMRYMWPIFILAPGLVFEFSYFTSKTAHGLLVPGGILTTIGIMFFFMTYTHFRFSILIAPVCILSVAVGLFQLYLFSGRPRGLLIPVGILTAIGGTFFIIAALNSLTSFVGYNLFLPLVLIIIGLFVIFGRTENKENF